MLKLITGLLFFRAIFIQKIPSKSSFKQRLSYNINIKLYLSEIFSLSESKIFNNTFSLFRFGK